ncbi:hypothetical protein F406_gp046 [Agrobacterium phage 7-7-1]|uniref:Uncharacterized protein n=1 Tax=Agrobacterium phage 7-7-1 TaxID=1161931 RepID=J7FA69_9CAUD|nr:hypothetical protein F406_gp046 [Agrobacterium phage 7-7-1]AFH19769.1 hypothetical protein 7-7-1_00071 [Agrobacterium phage 7-7-1]
MSIPNEESLTMTFTAHEWRLLAIAAVKVKSSVFINGAACSATLKNVAERILKETGK